MARRFPEVAWRHFFINWVAAIAGVLGYLAYAYIHKLSLFDDLNLEEIEAQFERLANEKIERHIQGRLTRGRFSIWVPPFDDDKVVEHKVYILQIDPDKTRIITGFIVPILEEKEECTSRGPMAAYREALSEKNYLFRAPSYSFTTEVTEVSDWRTDNFSQKNIQI